MASSVVLQAMKLLQFGVAYSKVGTLVSAMYEMIVAIGQAVLLFLVITAGVSAARNREHTMECTMEYTMRCTCHACSVRYAVRIMPQVSVAFSVLLGEHVYGDDDPEFGSPLAIPWFAIYGCAGRFGKRYF